jgi:hypothetical protein
MAKDCNYYWLYLNIASNAFYDMNAVVSHGIEMELLDLVPHFINKKEGHLRVSTPAKSKTRSRASGRKLGLTSRHANFQSATKEASEIEIAMNGARLE